MKEKGPTLIYESFDVVALFVGSLDFSSPRQKRSWHFLCGHSVAENSCS